jgi:outer membrane protein assembly factor BamB
VVVLIISVTGAWAGTNSRAGSSHPDVAAKAGNWPGWRGGDGSGICEDRELPTEWNETTNIVWKVPVPGSGHSSPIVWGDRLFLTTAEEADKRRSILCFSRTDGKLLWKADCPKRALEAKIDAQTGEAVYASATPVTDGERVYAFFASAGVMAVDFAGKQVWHRDLGEFASEYGVASSPILVDDKLIVNGDQGTIAKAGNSFIIALNRLNGETVWRTERTGQPHSWSTPVVVRVEGTERGELVLNGGNKVWSYDPATGEPLWSVDGTTIEVTPTVVGGDGLVYSVSGPNGPTLAIRPGGRGNVTASHVVWQGRRGAPNVPSPALTAGRLYMVGDKGIVMCFDAKTGKQVFQSRLTTSNFSASPVVAGDKVYITSEAGDTFIFAADVKLKVIGKNSLGEPCFASPAVSRGQIFMRTQHHLWCIGQR